MSQTLSATIHDRHILTYLPDAARRLVIRRWDYDKYNNSASGEVRPGELSKKWIGIVYPDFPKDEKSLLLPHIKA